MKMSLLPLLVSMVFIFCFALTRRAGMNQYISVAEKHRVYTLLLALLLWTWVSTLLGMRGTHLLLMQRIPLLWQACVPVIIVITGMLVSKKLQSGVHALVANTPWHWLIFIQALRIAAIGTVIKGIHGEISSAYVFWVGIPDFLFGLSALIVGWLALKHRISPSFLLVWNLVGASLILLPTFLATNYWMSEPGFAFIFEFPMVLAPSIVVPMFVLLNLLTARHMHAIRIKQRITSLAYDVGKQSFL